MSDNSDPSWSIELMPYVYALTQGDVSAFFEIREKLLLQFPDPGYSEASDENEVGLIERASLNSSINNLFFAGLGHIQSRGNHSKVLELADGSIDAYVEDDAPQFFATIVPVAVASARSLIESQKLTQDDAYRAIHIVCHANQTKVNLPDPRQRQSLYHLAADLTPIAINLREWESAHELVELGKHGFEQRKQRELYYKLSKELGVLSMELNPGEYPRFDHMKAGALESLLNQSAEALKQRTPENHQISYPE